MVELSVNRQSVGVTKVDESRADKPRRVGGKREGCVCVWRYAHANTKKKTTMHKGKSTTNKSKTTMHKRKSTTNNKNIGMSYHFVAL